MTDTEARRLAELILPNTEQVSLNDSPLCVIARHLIALLERTRLTAGEQQTVSIIGMVQLDDVVRGVDCHALLRIIRRLTTQPEAGGGLQTTASFTTDTQCAFDAPASPTSAPEWEHAPRPWFVHDFTELGGGVTISCDHPATITVAEIANGMTGTDDHAGKLKTAHLIVDAVNAPSPPAVVGKPTPVPPLPDVDRTIDRLRSYGEHPATKRAMGELLSDAAALIEWYACTPLPTAEPPMPENKTAKFKRGDRVRKIKGFQFGGKTGAIVLGSFEYADGSPPFVNVQHPEGWVMHFREEELELIEQWQITR